jgi:peptide/nickel transport system permease protein
MVSDAIQNFDSWWLGVFPGLAILTVVVAFNFVGDALRDALDPKSNALRGGGPTV